MLKNSISWFEIPAINLERAKKFYSAVLGAPITDMPMPNTPLKYASLPFDRNDGVGGALVMGEGYEPSNKGPLLWFNVEDEMGAVLSKAEESGGKILMPKTSAGQYGFIAHILDSEGNRIVIHSLK